MKSSAPDRADHLARQILERVRTLAISEPGSDRAAGESWHRRLEDQVLKVLTSQAGVTDGIVVALVTRALPAIGPRREFSDRERQEFADFIRQHVPMD